MIPVMILAMLTGPTVAGILLTGMVDGRRGYRDLLSRLLRWKVGIGRYAAALLIAPLLMAATPFLLTPVDPGYFPHAITLSDKAPLLRIGLLAGLAVGFFEELGWTGFVVPRLRLRFSLAATGLIVGLLLGAWHVLVNLCSSGTPAGTLSWPNLLGSLFFSFGVLPSYRVLMVWVNDRTGSLPVAMLMHFSLTASNIILPTVTSGKTDPVWTLTLSAALWIVVAVTTVASRRRITQPSGATGDLVGSRH